LIADYNEIQEYGQVEPHINVGSACEQTAKLDYPVEPGNDKEAARLGNNPKGYTTRPTP